MKRVGGPLRRDHQWRACRHCNADTGCQALPLFDGNAQLWRRSPTRSQHRLPFLFGATRNRSPANNGSAAVGALQQWQCREPKRRASSPSEAREQECAKAKYAKVGRSPDAFERIRPVKRLSAAVGLTERPAAGRLHSNATALLLFVAKKLLRERNWKMRILDAQTFIPFEPRLCLAVAARRACAKHEPQFVCVGQHDVTTDGR